MREITNRAGVTYSIHPLTHGRLLAAAKALRRDGVVMKPSEEALDSNLEFQVAVSRAVTAEIRQGERTLSDGEVATHYLDTPGAMDFVLKAAGELAEEIRKSYEVERGN